MDKADFRVVIVGGSVAGLSLALALEKYGIDFVVIEAFPDVKAHVGAALVLLPNGLRILDQLGCYETMLQNLPGNPEFSFHIRSPEGKTLFQSAEFGDRAYELWGHPQVFLPRHVTFAALYDSLRDKSKVLVGKRLKEIITTSSGVQAVIGDGSTIQGSILVGADGIHSTVRREMWRLGHEQSPGYFIQDEESRIPCYYKAIFGISQGLQDLPKSQTTATYNYGSCLTALTDNEGKIFWFFFKRLEETAYGGKIPRYTKEDEKKVYAEHKNDVLYPGITYGDLYDNSTMTIMTPIHEYIFDRWHYGKIMTIGDAAHKVSPMLGQGANSAIESAAVLADLLQEAVNNGPAILTDVDVEKVFSKTQAARFKRVKHLLDAGTHEARMEAFDTKPLELAARYMLPHIGLDNFLDDFGKQMADAVTLKGLKVPKRARIWRFNDELPAPVIPESCLPWIVVLTCLIFLLVADVGKVNMDGTVRPPVVQLTFDELVNSYSVHESGVKYEQQASDCSQLFHQLAQSTPASVIWTLESYRSGNIRSVIAWLGPSLFAVGALWDIPYASPLVYYLSYMLFSRSKTIVTTTIPRAASSAITRAVFGLYTVSGLMILCRDMIGMKGTAFIIRLCPVGVEIFSFVLFRQERNILQSVDKSGRIWSDSKTSSGHLRFLYSISVSMTIISCIWLHQRLYFGPRLFLAHSRGWTFGDWVDGQAIGTVLFCIYNIYQMRRRGYIITKTALVSALAVVIVTAAIGPSAAYLCMWWWRDHTLHGLTITDNSHAEKD